MTVKLLTAHHLEFLSLKGGCTGSSESTLVKMPHCWKSNAAAQIEGQQISPEDFEFVLNGLVTLLLTIYILLNKSLAWIIISRPALGEFETLYMM